ncbi:hypothetical protein BSL78_03403 [Apostichopus japonicus]|uniref:Uncharacterized protein n=1 Tax=Stichopus japonicus TaxID=307972 RepID=A0A2G8LHH3_STIJA|nr:hypothetical protein BSL78_03403 [Apostichopus japonicus]
MERDIKLLKAEKRELSDELENLKKSQRMETKKLRNNDKINRTGISQIKTRTHSQEIAVLKQQIANLEWKLGNSKMERSQNDMRSKDGFEERGAFPPSKGNPTQTLQLAQEIPLSLIHLTIKVPKMWLINSYQEAKVCRKESVGGELHRSATNHRKKNK